MSRRRKSNEEHHRDGTFQPCRHEKTLPEVSIPLKPEGLTCEAARLWDDLIIRLKSNGTLSNLDGIALYLLCESFSTYVEACEMIEKHGFAFKTKMADGKRTKMIPNPAISVRKKSWREVVTLCRQFGMTPRSRKALPEKKNDEPESFLDQFK